MDHTPLIERTGIPIYTTWQVSTLVGIPESTFRKWVQERALLTSVPPTTHRGPTLPFVAIAEAQLYRGLIDAGISPRGVREGMERVRAELGDRMLDQGVLSHDGVAILSDYGANGPSADWQLAWRNPMTIPRLILAVLAPIQWGDDGKPIRVHLTQFRPEVVADARYQFGQPILTETGARVEDLVFLHQLGDSVATIAQEFGVTEETVESIVRTHADAS